MGRETLLNICFGLFATIFFVQMQQKSISASIPAMRNGEALFNFNYLGYLSEIYRSEGSCATNLGGEARFKNTREYF